jgi:VanZ family protein
MPQPHRPWKALHFLPAIFYMGLIFHLSGRPANPVLQTWPIFFGIKLVHLLEYGLLCALWLFAFHRGSPWSPRMLWMATWSIVVLWGISDEIHQSFIPDRTAKGMDVVADAIAATLMIGADFVYQRFASVVRNKAGTT